MTGTGCSGRRWTATIYNRIHRRINFARRIIKNARCARLLKRRTLIFREVKDTVNCSHHVTLHSRRDAPPKYVSRTSSSTVAGSTGRRSSKNCISLADRDASIGLIFGEHARLPRRGRIEVGPIGSFSAASTHIESRRTTPKKHRRINRGAMGICKAAEGNAI